MARDFSGTEQRLTVVSSLTIAGEPITLAGWINSDDPDVRGTVITIGSTGSNYWAVESGGDRPGDPFIARQRGTAGRAIESSTGYTTGVWHHGCAIFRSDTDRSIYIDGGSRVDDSVASVTVAPTDFVIGSRVDGAQDFNGKVAEVGIWNVGLEDSEVEALAGGASPFLIRPGSLVAYVPILGRNSPEPNLINGANLSLTGAPATEIHPRIYYPAFPHISFITATAAAATAGAESFFVVGSVWSV